MRVTDHGRWLMVRQHLDRTGADLERTMAQLASGRRVNRYSDDPGAAGRANTLSTELAALDVYTGAARDASVWLTTQDEALQGMSSTLRRAREITLNGANSTLSPEARAGLATELRELRDQLATFANTSVNGRAVFGGFGDGAVQLTPTTATLTADGGAQLRRVGADQTIQINVSAADVLGFAAGDDVFTVLAEVADAVENGDQAVLQTGLTRLAARAADVSAGLGTVGSRANAVEAAITANEQRMDTVRDQRSSLVDIDMAQAAVELTRAESAYQTVLAATARLDQPTLADYLR